MDRLETLPVWKALQAERDSFVSKTLVDLFAEDPHRVMHCTRKIDGLTFDFSRTHITDHTLDLLVDLASVRNVPAWRDKMFAGKKINTTENRAVLHTALRAQNNDPILVDGVDVVRQIRTTQRQIEHFVQEVHEGFWRGATGEKIRHIVNIGIGGSDLGPRLAASALRTYTTSLEAHFVANVDAAELKSVLRDLDPSTTLFVVASKTFTTQETLMNASAARRWLVEKLGESAVAKHFVAVSTNLDAVKNFGIAPNNIFPMWDWVGGRYSLWSAVGLSVALVIGWSAFSDLLKGAAAMDAHFRQAPLRDNIPVLLALSGLWYRNFWGAGAHGILPYDERLRDLPRYLQQLEMESNGKSVDREGRCLTYPTCPVIFGECGSVGQHSFHQWLHQGTDRILVDFIGIAQDDWAEPEQHKALLSNLKAQAEALKAGKVYPDEPHRTNPGNKPSHILWLERLDPYHLGLLLALYEHKTFVQGAIWGINSFDQFGVELGKKLATQMVS